MRRPHRILQVFVIETTAKRKALLPFFSSCRDRFSGDAPIIIGDFDVYIGHSVFLFSIDIMIF
jgi:hypothetical protein